MPARAPPENRERRRSPAFLPVSRRSPPPGPRSARSSPTPGENRESDIVGLRRGPGEVRNALADALDERGRGATAVHAHLIDEPLGAVELLGGVEGLGHAIRI